MDSNSNHNSSLKNSNLFNSKNNSPSKGYNLVNSINSSQFKIKSNSIGKHSKLNLQNS